MTAATLAAIKRQFAGRDHDLERAFERSGAFRGLCRDYLTCLAALGRWRDVDSAEARARAAEYSELLVELAQEIETQLRPRDR